MAVSSNEALGLERGKVIKHEERMIVAAVIIHSIVELMLLF